MKYLIIDKRMRKIEKETLKNLGYKLIELQTSQNVYEEISSHVDIFCTKIKDKLVVEKSRYEFIKNKLGDSIHIVKGEHNVSKEYPYDISYNVCILRDKAIHNFKYSDKKIIEILEKENFKLINVSQGYSNCSIAVIDENSIIITDRGIYNELKDHGLDILSLDYELDIKLLNSSSYSKMKGFIGGAISRVGDNIFVAGDLNEIDKENKIRKFIESKNLKVIDFKDLDVIDYGGVLEL